jgi:hypothetical protein
MADAIDAANLVARLPERCDAGHGSDVMRVTKTAFFRPAGGDWARSDLARPGAALAAPAAQERSTIFVTAVTAKGGRWN